MDTESFAPFEWRNVSISPSLLMSGGPTVTAHSFEEQPLTFKVLLNDPESPLGGNKACKLRPYLQQAQSAGYRGLLGFGGAYSNFILSLALAGRANGFATIGIIRGDEIPDLPPEKQSQVLAAAAAAGMQLHFVNRSTYRQRSSATMLASLVEQFPGFLIVPEGGSSIDAARACGALLPDDADAGDITHWVVAAGSGATCAGIAAACTPPQKVLAITVVKDPDLQSKATAWAEELASQSGNPDIAERLLWVNSGSSASFGQLDRHLCDIINDCFESSGVLLDPVYTVKALHSLGNLAAQGEISATDRIALIHTGGLTGWLGMRQEWKAWLSDRVLHKIASLHWQAELGRAQ